MNRKAHPHEHTGELNIVPYLDIMVNLVMFMLMNIAGFITFSMIPINMPEVSADQAPPSDPSTPPPPEEKKFVLNVSISQRGFFIAATGGVLPGDAPADPNAPPPDPNTATPTIPCKKTGPNAQNPGKEECIEYDFQALTDKMVAIKKTYPSVSQYFLAADRDVKFKVVVGTMDATRGDSTHALFPDVAFAAVSD